MRKTDTCHTLVKCKYTHENLSALCQLENTYIPLIPKFHDDKYNNFHYLPLFIICIYFINIIPIIIIIINPKI